MATRREVYNQLVEAAMRCYDEGEARQIAEMIITERGGISRNALIVEPNEELTIPDLETILAQLSSWQPVQYILGVADFSDLSLEVNSDVLIPRPETEELVAWVAEELSEGAHILDACTGSGCIAIALARLVANSHVWAFDISEGALNVAKRNASRYASNVHISRHDALKDFSTITSEKLDAVVSNPPYIPLSDISLMRPNVTEYEPHTALFVEDSDPLIFYRSIARTARTMLKTNGKLYFEIYESLVEDMCSMLSSEGYTDIVVRNDFRDKPRMICARVSSIAR